MDRKVPFNEIAHIDPMTMAFVLSLRDQPDAENPMMKGLSEEDLKLLEAENAPLRKGQTNCHSKNCKDVKMALQAAILDGGQAKKETKKFEKEIVDHNENINAVQEQISAVDEDHESIKKDVLHINRMFAEKTRHLKDVKKKNQQLQIRIAKAEKYFRQLQSVLNNQSLSSSSVSSSSFRGGNGKSISGSEDDVTESGPIDRCKHNGTYTYVEAKRGLCWTCCLNELKNCKLCRICIPSLNHK